MKEQKIKELTEQKLKIYEEAQETLVEFLNVEPDTDFENKIFEMLKDYRNKAIHIEEEISKLFEE